MLRVFNRNVSGFVIGHSHLSARINGNGWALGRVPFHRTIDVRMLLTTSQLCLGRAKVARWSDVLLKL